MGGSGDLALDQKREAERRKAHLGNSRGLFPGSPGNRGTRQRLSTFRRGGVALVRASGDLAHDDFAPLPVPVQPALSGRPRQWGRTDTQVLPRTKSHVSPRPQAPLPPPRSKASLSNAPSS